MQIEPMTLMAMGEPVPHFECGLAFDNERITFDDPLPAFQPSGEFATALRIAGWRGVVRNMMEKL
jgi:hypothetical protein